MTEKLKGTTTVGIVCKDGVVLAADKRASYGNMVMSKGVTKVFQINDHLALAGVGSVGDILSLVRLLRAESRLYLAKVGQEMGVSALATLTANVLHNTRFAPYYGWFLIAGHKGKPALHSIDMAGGLTDEGVKLALKAVNTAMRRDVFTGDGVTPVTVTSEGYTELSREEVDALLK